MKHLFLSIVFCFLLVSRGYSGGFSSLKLGTHARAEAMGMAHVALVQDGSASFWNPAGLVAMPRKDIILSVHRWIQDVSSQFLGFGLGGASSGFGLHVLYTEVGGIEQRIGPSPTPLGTFSAHELVAGISYARLIGSRIRLGVTLKMLYEKIYIDEAVGFAGDVGLLWDVWEDGLRLGAVLQHLGKTNPLRDEEIPLPLTARLGFAYGLDWLGCQWILVVDGVKEDGFPFHVHGGAELGWKDRFFLRFGYMTGYDNRNMSGGLGLSWKRYRMDYSYAPIGNGLGDSHHLSVGIGW